LIIYVLLKKLKKSVLLKFDFVFVFFFCPRPINPAIILAVQPLKIFTVKVEFYSKDDTGQNYLVNKPSLKSFHLGSWSPVNILKYFLSNNSLRPCRVITADFSKAEYFSTRIITETKLVSLQFIYISDCSKIIMEKICLVVVVGEESEILISSVLSSLLRW